MTACDACLRRSALVALLAPHIERARRNHRHIAELLALSDERLLAALGGQRIAELQQRHATFDPHAARTRIVAAGLQAFCRHDDRYPTRLARTADAPAVLHLAGDADRLVALTRDDAPAVAIVGARRAGPDGLEIARGLGRGLAAAGVDVISGMALGIDSAAHAGALEVGGPTLTVLASGADVPYPPSKRALYRAIVRTQAAISEMPPGFRPFRWCFPARNRTIAALASLTIVVEATERSGSLITAELAQDLGRAVGAVPGTSRRCARRDPTRCCVTERSSSATHRTRSTRYSESALRPPSPVADRRSSMDRCARCYDAWKTAATPSPHWSTHLLRRSR